MAIDAIRIAQLREGSECYCQPAETNGIITELLDEIERLQRQYRFRALLGNSYLNRYAAVWVHSMETDPTTAINFIEEDVADGFFGVEPVIPSRVLRERADDLMRQALEIAP